MPKLSKVRITGNKYDGFQKKHEDSVFNLASDHSLFTMQNGSGKGVMLQLVSQIILPGTSWGSNNGNKVEGMFYDRYNVFRPYTFHVVLEWDLDGSQDGMLLAGICVSAHRQKSPDDSEGKVGLKYFLYTHKYKGDSRFSLENLPLYSKTNDEALPYENLESFIEENSRYFRKYAKSSVASLNSDYYQYLASHGIYRSEWEIMKTINRSEGGLEKYFSQARDNQALFDKLIIPAVSESISSRSEENEKSLLNMFVNNIKIAENLPELISRTEDINQLLMIVEPLVVDAQQGTEFKKIQKELKQKGNNYLSTLINRQENLKSELENSQVEKEKAENKLKELNYQKYNLKYARKIREKKRLKEKITNYAQKITKLQEKLEKLIKEKKKLKLNQFYLSHRQFKNELEKNKNRIKELKKSLDIADIRQEIEQLKENIKSNWPELKKEWENSSRNVDAYKRHLSKKGKQLLQLEEKLENNIREKGVKIDKYKDDQKELKNREEQLVSRFNPLQLGSPFYFVEQISVDIEEENNKLKELNNKIVELGEEIEQLKDKREKEKIELARQDSDYQGLKKNYQKRKNKEDKIFASILKLLELDKHREVYSSDWLAEKQISLKKLLKDKKLRLQNLYNKYYECELDLALNEDDHWIANHDQKQLYDAIKALNISVNYGSYFLQNISRNQEKLLANYPLLPYGLILMYEADWNKVKKNLKSKDVFRAPVPVFINHQLEKKKEEDYLKLVHGRELEFITSPGKYKDWYNGLSRQQKEIEETIDTLEKKIKNINQLIYDSKELQQEKSADELKEEMSKLAANIDKINKKINKKNKDLKRLEKNKNSLAKRISDKQKKISNLEKDFREIKEFAAETRRLKELKPEIEEAKESISNLKKSKSENSTKREQNTELKLTVKNDFEYWHKELHRFLAELKDIIPGAKFKNQVTEKVQQNYPQFYDYHDSQVYNCYQQLLDQQKKEEDKNVELKFLRERGEKLKEQIFDLEEDMNSIDPDWRSYSFTLTKRLEVRQKLDIKEEKIKQEKGKIESIREELATLNGELNSEKRQIKELFKEINERFQKAARSWPDLDLNKKELNINNALKENKELCQNLLKKIDNFNNKIRQIDTLIIKLEYYRLDAEKGNTDNLIKEEIKHNPKEIIEKWIRDYQEIDDKVDKLREKTENDYYKFKRNVNELLTNDILKSRIKEKIIQDFRSEDFSYNLEMLTSFREYLHNELNRIDDDKSEAERARKQWAERSAMHVMRIISSLQEMISNMVYHNQRGYTFPLVRLRRNDLLPEKEEEIVPELKEYFIEVIEKFKEKDIRVDRLTESQLKEYTGDAALFSRTVRGRYPVLQVYKMTEKNEFQYARPQDYFYADWESVIQGKGDTPEGSGGQSLSINAFMMMMLLNYKKQRLDRSNPWTVLFLDNPFGKASAAHVLDPVFEIAEKLNFQIIAFAAPEIIKTEISERFPVFWALEINNDNKGQGIVAGQVVYGERIRKTETTI